MSSGMPHSEVTVGNARCESRHEMIDIAWRCESRILYAMLALLSGPWATKYNTLFLFLRINFFFGAPFFAHPLHCLVFASWAIAIHSFIVSLFTNFSRATLFWLAAGASASPMLLGALLFLESRHQSRPTVHIFDARETTVPQSNGFGSSGLLVHMTVAANPGAPRSK